ncbi:hypothetical protein BCIN_03g07780 [Botrytis cinerea B05.10]|uniref:Dynactin arp1 p25 subunit protein n=3 Tax=Botryotinia fuckeliana TaxID=40559 RepID=A0A384JDA0_BOTFB|nr:hypothetical protein BCIN_03g07780 [Botrytis cinerea B05.10]ATZ48585.1 hypothetical protein BCIN_03g07780 [Botrytis cinerea B05.10]EMR81328.1 putative dynactin arp1 p25 subunit protein [Botrytis cinerea BcDW1]CCD45265.1 hypothetical protein BofuT4_P050550.1 [Botrytis cinerea T4]
MVFITSIVKVAALAGLLAPTVLATLPEALVVKRQDEDNAVGTNSYNCHDNCGEAILESEIDGFCNTTIFSTDYAACLQCSGEDNEDIWQYYGPYLTVAAVECGSSTVPLTGTQADVATAMLAQNVTTTASGATATVASNSATTTAASSSSGSASSSESTASSGSASSTATESSASATSTSGAIQQINAASGFLIGGVSILVAAAVANLA